MEVLFFWVGATLLFIGILFIHSELSLRNQSLERPGVIIGFSSSKSSESKPLKAQVFKSVAQFTHPNGNSYLVESFAASSWPIHDQGEKVTVLVSRSGEPTGQILSSMNLWIGAIFCLIGFLFVSAFIKTFSFQSLDTTIAIVVSLVIIYKIHQIILKKIQEIKKKDQLRFITQSKLIPVQEWRNIRWCAPETIHQVYKRAIQSQKIIRPILVILIFSFLAGAYFFGKKQMEFMKTAVAGSGTVVELQAKRGKDRNVYTPIVEFKDHHGKTVRFRHRISSTHPSYKVGDAVEVLYSPSSSQNAIVDAGPLWNYFAPLLLSTLGIFFTWMFFASHKNYHKTYTHPFADESKPIIVKAN